MFFKQFFDTISSTYTYLLADTQEKSALLIDPVLDNITDYLYTLEQEGLTLRYVLDTHTHADHISANGLLRKKTHCKTYIGEQAGARCVDNKLSHLDTIPLGSLILTALHTPGHTDDSYSFHLKHNKEHYLFTGDTLLIQGSGRTDFQNGDAKQQYHSIFDILLSYPEHCLVYPGHDYNGRQMSTIGDEKKSNPRLKVNNENEYADIMNGLKLPNPKLMDIAVPANERCGE